MAASSASSSSGSSASSRRSFSIRARWLSLWLLTETYPPSAMDTAPPTSPAAPAARMGPDSAVAPATPTTIAATETMPSFAPRTPARSQFSRWAMSVPCGSVSIWRRSSGPAASAWDGSCASMPSANHQAPGRASLPAAVTVPPAGPGGAPELSFPPAQVPGWPEEAAVGPGQAGPREPVPRRRPSGQRGARQTEGRRWPRCAGRRRPAR